MRTRRRRGSRCATQKCLRWRQTSLPSMMAKGWCKLHQSSTPPCPWEQPEDILKTPCCSEAPSSDLVSCRPRKLRWSSASWARMKPSFPAKPCSPFPRDCTLPVAILTVKSIFLEIWTVCCWGQGSSEGGSAGGPTLKPQPWNGGTPALESKSIQRNGMIGCQSARSRFGLFKKKPFLPSHLAMWSQNSL